MTVLAFSPNGNFVLELRKLTPGSSANANNSDDVVETVPHLMLSNVVTAKMIWAVNARRLGVIIDFAIGPNGFGASASKGGQVKVWHMKNGKERWTPVVNESKLAAVEITPDGELLLVACERGVLVFNLTTTEFLGQLSLHSTAVHSMTVSSDGRRLLSHASDKTCRLWDLEKLTCLKKFRCERGEAGFGLHGSIMMHDQSQGRVTLIDSEDAANPQIELKHPNFCVSKAMAVPQSTTFLFCTSVTLGEEKFMEVMVTDSATLTIEGQYHIDHMNHNLYTPSILGITQKSPLSKHKQIILGRVSRKFRVPFEIWLLILEFAKFGEPLLVITWNHHNQLQNCHRVTFHDVKSGQLIRRFYVL